MHALLGLPRLCILNYNQFRWKLTFVPGDKSNVPWSCNDNMEFKTILTFLKSLRFYIEFIRMEIVYNILKFYLMESSCDLIHKTRSVNHSESVRFNSNRTLFEWIFHSYWYIKLCRYFSVIFPFSNKRTVSEQERTDGLKKLMHFHRCSTSLWIILVQLSYVNRFINRSS